MQVAASADVWTCENGRRTVLHAVAYDVCQAGPALLRVSLCVTGLGSLASVQSCFNYYAYGHERLELSKQAAQK